MDDLTFPNGGHRITGNEPSMVPTESVGRSSAGDASPKMFSENVSPLWPSILEWGGIASVRSASMKYHLHLEYKIGSRPRIRVIEPNLEEIAEGRKVPHQFSQVEQTLAYTSAESGNLI